MSEVCKICQGHGRWGEQIDQADGTTEVQWHYCEDCKGTGINQDPKTGDDFDADGSSYANDD